MIFTKKPLLIVLLFAISFGMALADFDALYSQGAIVDGEVTISCRVKEADEELYLMENLVIDGKEVKGKAYLRSTKRQLHIGDEITLKGELKTYDVDVFDTSSASLYADEIYYKIDNYAFLRWETGKRTFFERVKLRLEEGIERYLTPENAGVMKSLLFGDKTTMYEEDNAVLTDIGLAHVFAVSGLHVGILALFLSFILRKVRVPSYLVIALTAVVVVLYGVITGFPAGVKRALVMYLIASLAKPLGRKNDSLTSLSLAAGVILLTHPRELFDIGFLMSVSAVLGIVCFYKPLYTFLSRISANRIVRYGCKLIATTISANVLILPIQFNVYNSVPTYSVLSNVLILPILTVVFPFAMLTAIFSLFWTRFSVLYYPTGFVLDGVRSIARFLYSLPYSHVDVNGLGWLTAVYVAVLLFCSPYVLAEKKYKHASLGVLGAAFFLFSFL